MVPDPWDFTSLPILKKDSSEMNGSLSLSDDDEDKIVDEFLETMRSKKRKITLQSNLSHPDTVVDDFVKATLQSNQEQGVVGNEVEGEKIEIVSYDQSESEGHLSAAAIYDDVASNIYTGDFELGDFLSRPVEIKSGEFDVGSNFTTVGILPWSLFLNDAAIIKKISNYSYIQCKLKVKIVINSTQFIYGLYGMSYHPHHTWNPISSNGDDFRCLSQRPTIWIEPHKNKGGVIELPFFHYNNWLKLDHINDSIDMGKLTLYQVVQSQAANADLTNKPSYTVYAWAEDVKLCGNTVKAVLQSKKDEYGNKPISSMASAVSSVAESLSNLPVIAPFAKATQIGADAVGAISSVFGFTNVPVIDNAVPYKSMPFHGLASTEISNVVDKLTLDPKNELCIAPGTVGLPDVDELAIQHLISKEAILTTVDWEQTSAQDTSLFRSQVTPTMCNPSGEANQTKLLDTPLGMVSRLCSNWRGDIIVRVKIIASQYHRGRLRVSYDPTGDIFTNPVSTTVVQTKIIDISDQTDIQFRIPYMAATSWLRTRDGLHHDYEITTADSTMTYDEDFHNGRFQIRVLNPLTAPINTATAKLVISVKGADNFEIANPSDINFGQTGLPSPFTVQSNMKSGTIDDETGEEVCTMVMGSVAIPPKNRYLVNMGEQFQSLRTLLRRSCMINNELALRTGAGVNSTQFYKYTMTKYPPSYGYDTNGMHSAEGLVTPASDFNFNYASVTPYTWIAPCFVGQRGSMIWHFNASFTDGVDSVKVRRITETDVDTQAELRVITSNYASGSYSDSARNSISKSGPGVSGLSLVNQRTQAGLSVLMPQYSKYRFVSTDPANATYGRDSDDTENEKFVVEMVVPNSTDNTPCTYERYSSVGTDFNLFYFLNVPPRYVYALPTAGASP